MCVCGRIALIIRPVLYLIRWITLSVSHVESVLLNLCSIHKCKLSSTMINNTTVGNLPPEKGFSCRFPSILVLVNLTVKSFLGKQHVSKFKLQVPTAELLFWSQFQNQKKAEKWLKFLKLVGEKAQEPSALASEHQSNQRSENFWVWTWPPAGFRL